MPKSTPTLDEYVKEAIQAAEVAYPYIHGSLEQANLGNKTPEMLVDVCGAMNNILKDFEKTKKTLNGVIDSKLMPEEFKSGIAGEQFKLKFIGMTQNRLDGTKAVELLKELGASDAQIASCYYDLDIIQHRYSKV